MAIERRYQLRTGMTCRVDYADAQGRANIGLMRDISADGMFIEHTPSLTIGKMVMTAFLLPNGQACKLKAKVIRLIYNGAGLRFVDLSLCYPGGRVHELADVGTPWSPMLVAGLRLH